MEVIGAVASIAGILAFAGEAIGGASKVVAFVDGMKGARKKMDKLEQHLGCLKWTLRNVRTYLKLLERNESQHGLTLYFLPIIGEPVERCRADLAEMEEELSKLALRAGDSIFERTKIALEPGRLEEIMTRMSFHHQRIHESLTLFKQIDDKAIGINIQELTAAVGLTEEHLKLNAVLLLAADHHLQREEFDVDAILDAVEELKRRVQRKEFDVDAILDAVEELKRRVQREEFDVNAILDAVEELKRRVQREAVVAEDEESTQGTNVVRVATWGACRSRQDWASRASRTSHKSAASRATGNGQKTRWSCSAITGVDDGFGNGLCIFCGGEFAEEVGHFRSRSDHLIKAHAWSACHQDDRYSSWAAMAVHLKDFHGLAAAARSPADEDGLSSIFRLSDSAYWILRRQRPTKKTPTQVPTQNHAAANSGMRRSLAADLQSLGPLAEPARPQGWLPEDRVLIQRLKYLDVKSAIQHHDGIRDCRLVALALRAACTEERGIVEDDDFFAYNKDKTENWRFWPGRGVKFARVWICREPVGNGDFEPTEAPFPLSSCNACKACKACKACEVTTFYCCYHDAIKHLMDHGISPNEAKAWVQKRRLDLNRFWRRRWAKCGDTAARIRLWSFGCFVESAPLRAILQTSKERKWPPAEKQTHQAYKFSGRWERTVLQDWVKSGIDKYRSNVLEHSDIESHSDRIVAEESGDIDNGSNREERSDRGEPSDYDSDSDGVCGSNGNRGSGNDREEGNDQSSHRDQESGGDWETRSDRSRHSDRSSRSDRSSGNDREEGNDWEERSDRGERNDQGESRHPAQGGDLEGIGNGDAENGGGSKDNSNNGACIVM